VHDEEREKLYMDRSIVKIRALTMEDSEAIYPLMSDGENSRFITFIPHPSLDYTKDYIEWHMNNGFYYAITLFDDDTAIGYVGVDKDSIERELGKIGYVINKRYWGCGYTPGAIKTVTEEVLANSEIRQIMATIKPENISSQRCIEKAGYVFIKRLENYESSAVEDTSRTRLLYHAK
jgi:[ribosomal protein S5]-alanine N-acetyltransferase